MNVREPATDAVLQLCRRELGAAAALRTVEALNRSGSAREFQELADGHHVLGLVLARLEKLLPADVRATPAVTTLLEPLHARRRLALLWDLERHRVLRFMHARGVRPLLLKGAALRLTVYSDPVERALGDLDVLVGPDQIEPAFQGVLDAGYQAPGDRERTSYERHHFHLRFLHPRGFMTEVHWGLLGPVRPFRLDPHQFLRRACEVSQAGSPVALVPSPEDMVLHLASQNLENHFSELRRLVDLDRIVSSTPSLDWDDTVASARAGGLHVVLGLSLRLSDRLLGTGVPREVMRALSPPTHVAFHLGLLDPARSLVSQYARRRAAYGGLLSLWLAERWRDRLAQLVGMLTGRDEWLEELHDPEPSAPRVVSRIAALVKLLAFQGWRYVVGVRGLVRSRIV